MDHDNLELVLPLVSAAVLAILGWIFAWWQDRRAKAHAREAEIRARATAERVAHLNSQIRDLYGPLYARLIAGQEAWRSFEAEYAPMGGEAGYFAPGTLMTPEQLTRWQVWMEAVFHPNNQAMVRLILDNLHLVEGGDLPEAFRRLISHVTFYDGIIAQWRDGELAMGLIAPRDYTSVIDFPQAALEASLRPTYEGLLGRRQRLLEGGESG